MKNLTADIIAEALDADNVAIYVQRCCDVSFIHKGAGVIQATLYDSDFQDVETRTFRLVEVDS